MTWTRRLAVSTLLALIASSLALVATIAPAHAAAPVVVDDAGSMYAGNAIGVDVLANDSDADGDDELAICRIGETPNKKRFDVFIDGNVLVVVSSPSARPGQYEFLYYACDLETLTEGTLTVTIMPEPNIKLVKTAKPGRLKIKNPGNFKIDVLFGSFQEPEPDGVATIAKNSSMTIRVHRHKISWIAYHHRKGDFLRTGHVRNIKLPPGDHPPAAGRFSDRIGKLWAAGL